MGRPSTWLAAFALACAPAPTSTDGSLDESGTDSGETEATGDSDTGESLLANLTIVHHPNQPMVVDVLVELSAPGHASLIHLDDPGVRVARIDGTGPAATIHLRVRGLLPATVHGMELGIGELEGVATEVHPVEFETNPALPGFVSAFGLTLNQSELVDSDYRLFDQTALWTSASPSIFMIDPVGRVRWHFSVDAPMSTLEEIWLGLHLRDDGSVLAQRHDTVLIVDELGVEQVRVAAADLGLDSLHHDVIELPNGNFLSLTFEFADIEYPVEGLLHVAGDLLVEFTPAGELVWTWSSFEHLDPQRTRQGFLGSILITDPDTGEMAYDWTHSNGLIYADGIVYVSMRHQDWILAIDHASGEILWRLGDEGDFALDPGSTWFFHQHSPQWQADGSLLLYDNGVGNPTLDDDAEVTHAARYTIDFDAMTATRAWQDDDEPFISKAAGDADRTSLGHVLRLDSILGGVPGTGYSRMRELDPSASPNAVWSIDLPDGLYTYRAVPLDRLVGEPSR